MQPNRSYTPLLRDPITRSEEEFADYFIHALRLVDQRELKRMGISMEAMKDVFQTFYQNGFMRATVVPLEELNTASKGK